MRATKILVARIFFGSRVDEKEDGSLDPSQHVIREDDWQCLPAYIPSRGPWIACKDPRRIR